MTRSYISGRRCAAVARAENALSRRPGRASEEAAGGQGRTIVGHCLADHDDHLINSDEGECCDPAAP